MNDKEESRQIREQIRPVLMKDWDPIGVKNIPEAAEEYDLHLADVYRLVVQHASASKIAEYLRYVEIVQMELVDTRKERPCSTMLFAKPRQLA